MDSDETPATVEEAGTERSTTEPAAGQRSLAGRAVGIVGAAGLIAIIVLAFAIVLEVAYVVGVIGACLALVVGGALAGWSIRVEGFRSYLAGLLAALPLALIAFFVFIVLSGGDNELVRPILSALGVYALVQVPLFLVLWRRSRRSVTTTD